MSIKNRAFFLTASKQLEMREIPIPKIGPKEVLVRMGAIGVCGSDVHYYSHGRIGDFVVEYPFILGHECAGTVVETGAEVTKLHVGDRVALEPGISCGTCEMCRTGHYNLCPDVIFLATPPYNGCLMEYIAYPENYAFKLPDNMTLEQGALVEPMAIGVNAVLTGKVKAGDSVLIIGAGCIGLVTMFAAKSSGASTIIVSDIIKLRLDTALKLGASHTVDSRGDIVSEVMKITNGRGVDVVLDCAGFSSMVKLSMQLVRPNGRVVIVGMGEDQLNDIPLGLLSTKEVEITSIFRYKNLYPTTISLIAGGLADINGIVTKRFTFEQTAEAYSSAYENPSETVKNIIIFEKAEEKVGA
jgi:L-iditol 2-dehydrogenase